jgi:Ca-activated chloride channel family protein
MGPLFIVLLAWALPAEAVYAGQVPTFQTGVTWVRVDVQVGDKNRTLSGLTREDFVVYDEGRPQEIGYFGHDSEPLDLLLLLDVSGSMRRYLEQMAATAKEALRQLHPGDRVGVMLFSRRAEVHQDLTADFAQVEQGLQEAVRVTDLGSGTRINPAILSAAAHLASQPAAAAGSAAPRPGRRAVLIVTDNLSLNYLAPDEKAIESLLSADAVLNAIVVGRGERPKPPRPGEYVNPDFTPADVFRIAEDTGGEAVKAQRADVSFRDMIERIRTRYNIQYRAPEGTAGTFRGIRVDLSPDARRRHPRAWVRARSGYLVK